MAITRQVVLEVIERYECAAAHPLVENGQWGVVLDMEREGLVKIAGGDDGRLCEFRLTETGREELAKLFKSETNTYNQAGGSIWRRVGFSAGMLASFLIKGESLPSNVARAAIFAGIGVLIGWAIDVSYWRRK